MFLSSPKVSCSVLETFTSSSPQAPEGEGTGEREQHEKAQMHADPAYTRAP